MSAEKNTQADSSHLVRMTALHARVRPAVKELNRIITILGAGEGADLILGSSSVDAAHAAVVYLPDGAYVCDLGAPGGTLLNGRYIHWSRLSNGDQLAIGPFCFRIQLTGDQGKEATDVPMFQVRNDRTIGRLASREAAMVIGSDASCDVVLNDPEILPRHALLVWTREGTIVRDLTGRPSIRVNGRFLRMSEVSNGDLIGVGKYEMIYESTAEESAGVNERSRTVSSLKAVKRSRTYSATPWLRENDGDIESSACDEKSLNAEEAPFDPFVEETRGPTDGIQNGSYGESTACQGIDSLEEMTAANHSRWTSSVEQCPPELKVRVAAAQKALDERARKLREELGTERAQLKAYQDKLQEQARQLLELARQRQEESQDKRRNHLQETDTILTSGTGAERGADARWTEASAIESLFAGTFDMSAAATLNELRTGQTPNAHDGDDNVSLRQRVSELVNMVRDEKEEMRLAENRLESLRFDVDRLRNTVLRAKDQHKTQEAEHEARYTALKKSEATIRHERESLTAQMRRLDAKEAVLTARVEEAERIRSDLKAESGRLKRAQEQHDERVRELRINLEGERHRLRVRQADLQRKAAELVKMARARRKAMNRSSSSSKRN